LTAFFADTFYWVALTSTDDPAHERAMALSRSLTPEKLITTDDVLCEYLAFFADARSHVRFEAGEIVAELIEDPDMRVVPHSRETFLDGLRLYRARPDKGYRLVDCISMQTMRREGLTDVLTNDRHFEQEGFRALFRDS
jgi:predicted nucleic acid-binding protein